MEIITGDALSVKEPQRGNDGRFIQGEHYSQDTEFKKGEHWRKPNLLWCKDYLYYKYIILLTSTGDIAREHKCTDANVLYWLKKHCIQRRTISQARAVKHWGLEGEANPMYGKCGSDSPNWRGGITPERQLFNSSRAWKIANKCTWERDNATCQRCFATSKRAILHVHHLKGFDCVESRAHLPDLMLLCSKCHGFVHSKANTAKEFLYE